jgi:hypothetical protein
MFARRNHLVPVPAAEDLSALNRQLLASCQQEEQRVIGDRHQSVGSAMTMERAHLLPLAAEGFDSAQVRFAAVDSKGCVQVGGNAYSAPLRAGTKVQVKAFASSVELWHAGQRVAVHGRCYGRGQQVLDLEHYLEVLHHKPGALAGSKPLSQWREKGRWPACLDQLWERLQQRHGKDPGTKEMIELLLLGRGQGYEALVAAVEQALALGCSDAAAVRYLLSGPAASVPAAPLTPSELGALSRFERPLPEVASYDQLLEAAR